MRAIEGAHRQERCTRWTIYREKQFMVYGLVLICVAMKAKAKAGNNLAWARSVWSCDRRQGCDESVAVAVVILASLQLVPESPTQPYQACDTSTNTYTQHLNQQICVKTNG